MHLVVGSSGDLGFEVVQRLLANGHEVLAMVRSDTAEQRLRAAGAKTVRGDLRDRASLDRACKGIDCVVSTANSVKRGGADTLDAVDRQGNRDLVEAAKNGGVKRFVFVSLAGANPKHPFPLFAAKGETEEHIVASGIPYAIVQPHIFMDVWFRTVLSPALQHGQPVTLFEGGRKRHSFVASTDVAAFTVAGVEHPASTNRRLLVGGPSAHSWSDVVARAGSILGRELPVRRAQAGEPLPGPPPPHDQILGALLASLEQTDVIIDMRALYDEFSVRPTAVDDFLKRFLRS